MPPKDAFCLAEKFNMIYTPKKASWLNVIEIEFSALSRQCLNRRIGSIKELRNEVTVWTNKRIKDRVKITWLFSKEKAREKFSKKYKKIRELKY